MVQRSCLLPSEYPGRLKAEEASAVSGQVGLGLQLAPRTSRVVRSGAWGWWVKFRTEAGKHTQRAGTALHRELTPLSLNLTPNDSGAAHRASEGP